LAAIADVDTNPMTGAPEQRFILRSFPIVDQISRPSAPNSTYTNIQTFSGANSLTLTFQYRVICSAGTCGNDCSQTTNCQPFPSCVPITCADSPCLNNGTLWSLFYTKNTPLVFSSSTVSIQFFNRQYSVLLAISFSPAPSCDQFSSAVSF
jgi:hypothetical protein